jgi:hypothetical protein
LEEYEEASNLLVTPMLTENIGRVLSTINVIKSNNLGSNSLMDMVKGKGIVMMLVKLGVRGDQHGTINDHLIVVSKDIVPCCPDGHTKKVEGNGVKINDLINTSMSHDEL